MGFQLSRKDLVESIVIGDRCQLSRIGQSHRGERRTIAEKSTRPLLGEVHGVAEASTIATRQKSSARFEGGDAKINEGLKGSPLIGILLEGLQRLAGFLQCAIESLTRNHRWSVAVEAVAQEPGNLGSGR